MNTYYCFKISPEYFKMTENNPYHLYMVLSGLYQSSIQDVGSAYSLYQKLTSRITKQDTQTIFQKLKKDEAYQVYGSTHGYHNYYTKEKSKLYAHNSYFVIKSNKKKPIFLKSLSKINHLFLCDFKKREYYWLKKSSNNTLKIPTKKGIMG